jgi:flavin reductase (DIM6/NTAB) family NADH-FMN oxidoreductase RutF
MQRRVNVSNPMEPAAMDRLSLRCALGNFVTGVTVVTTMDELGRPRGLTANSFTSVSLDPPLVLVCIAATAASCGAFERCTGFTVNVLHEEQQTVAEIFASKSPDKFDRASWSEGATGAPRILGSLAIFDCQVHQRLPAGDHLILIGRVLEFDTAARRPLVFGQGSYISLSVQQAAVAQPSGRTVTVSCITDQQGRILLMRSGDGSWTLPGAVLAGSGSGELSSLKDALERIGAKVEITFLYSVFDDADNGVMIVYRGTLAEAVEETETVRLFPEADVPWDALRPVQCRGMLRRFFRERAIDHFGIYSDVVGEPGVARLKQDRPSSWGDYVSQLME